MTTRRNLAETQAILDAWTAWGFVEVHPDPPQRWRITAPGEEWYRMTALGQQWNRFMQVPQEEPSFLSAWLAAVERADLEVTREGGDPTFQALLEEKTRELYPLAKAGDVRAFHRALVELVTSRPEEESP